MRCLGTSMLATLIVLVLCGPAAAQSEPPPAPPAADATPPLPPLPVEATSPPIDDGWNWRATPPPPPVIAYTPRAEDDRKSLKVAGWVMLGAGYLVSAWIGGIIYVVNDDVEPSEDDDDDDRDEAWYLFIPVGGSLAYGISRGQEIAGREYQDELGRAVGLLLTLPTIVQTVGLCLAIAGHSKGSGKSDRSVAVTATPVVSPEGSVGVGISGSF